MRYLSEDGQVFNSEKECSIHEAAIKKAESDKKNLEEQKKDIERLMNLVDEANNKVSEMEQAVEAYEKKWKISFGDVFLK